MKIDKSRIQSCIDHINTAVDVDPWAKELVAEMGKEILKAQLSKEDATSDLQQTCNQLATDCISRQAVIDICNHAIDLWQGQLGEGALVAIKNAINNLPSVQPEIMPDGTLHITATADVANIDRILLSQEGTHLGDVYYKDDEKPKRKTGKWIHHKPFDCEHHNCNTCIECSCCGTWFGADSYAQTNYCPNCGAKMEEGEQE